MSSDNNTSSVETNRKELADAFDRRIDPLAQYSETFDEIDVDPFQMFREEILPAQSLTEATETDYDRTIDQWIEFMASRDRHPACPSEDHVRAFAQYYRDEVGNRPDTVNKKLLRLNKAFEYWQVEPVFPHPQDYNPFQLARSKLDLTKPNVKDPPLIPLVELREKVGSVSHIRDRLVIVLQLKLGIRAGELANIQIQDIGLTSDELQQCYSDLGSHSMLDGRSNAIYIPPASDTDLELEGRDGNKSLRPRVLPLDDEVRHLLIRYLMIRPDTGSPWVFLSKKSHKKLEGEGVNHVWITHFQPEYAETEQHRGVTSHFGRHFFTTYWRVEHDLNRDLMKYMRGDKTDGVSANDSSVIDDYIHAYYEDIEPIYRSKIFRLNL